MNLIEETIKEVKLLRVHTTEDERANLDIEKLNPALRGFCMYGMLTGYCFNERATELLNLCAKPVSIYMQEVVPADENGFETCPRDINPYAGPRPFSALEVYINIEDAQSANIIDYLQNKTDLLSL